MIDAQRFLTNTQNVLVDLLNPRKEGEEKKGEENLSEPVVRQGSGDYSKHMIVFALALFFFVIIKNAWLSDDAYITLRTVYNFIHGYGLTWNIDERVQTYTHPLWMFLLSGAYFFVRSVYFSSLLLSLGVSALAIGIFAFRLTKSAFVAVVGLAILAASKGFVDFSTSGLENPLTHLLIVVFALVFFQYQHSRRYILWLSLLGSLMILNRMDTVLLFLPALAYALFLTTQPRLKELRTMLLCFLPFIGWELFSLFYYGFLFPNTAYAKLNTGISTGQLLKQGLAYLISSSNFDPLLFVVPVCAILLVIVNRDRKSIALALGMVLYVAYVVKVGGDFMAGRFLTPPLLMAVILLVRNVPSSAKTLWAIILIVVVLLGFLVPNSRWYVINSSPQRLADSRGVADEHSYYASSTGLINFERTLAMPASPAAQSGLQAQLDGTQLATFSAIGYFGYEAGPHVHVLDNMALGDPLLARLPLDPQKFYDWRIGHFYRIIPPGYAKTLATGKNVIQDPGLALYYTKLHDVTSGPLFSGQRLLEIWKFNTGTYNSLLRHYIQSMPPPSQNPPIPAKLIHGKVPIKKPSKPKIRITPTVTH
jgi:arabinofuranosyltransferase